MSRALTGELEQLLDDAEDLLRLVRCFVEMRQPRWQGALEELQRLESIARDGAALVVGARSEETIAQHRASTRRAPKPAAAQQRGRAAPAKHRRGRTERAGVATEPGAASSSAAANRAA